MGGQLGTQGPGPGRLPPLHPQHHLYSGEWGVSWVPRAQDQVVFLLCTLNTTCTVVSGGGRVSWVPRSQNTVVSMGKEVRKIRKSHLAHSKNTQSLSVVVLHAQLNFKKRFNVHSLELLNLAKL